LESNLPVESLPTLGHTEKKQIHFSPPAGGSKAAFMKLQNRVMACDSPTQPPGKITQCSSWAN
jgi:hypothetical protein